MTVTAQPQPKVAERSRARAQTGRGARRGAGPVTYVILTCLALFAMGPIVLFFFNALKTTNEYATSSLSLPTSWQWSNFIDAWQIANMGAGLVNSVIIVVGTVVLTCLVAGCAAYALARLEILGANAFISYVLIVSSLPGQMFLVPLFSMWSKVGLYDTQLGLIIIYCGLFSPFATLLLRSFMIGIPREFEEAARVDGASELQLLFRIVLPNAWPGFLTIALTTGLSAYNEFLFAVTFIQNPQRQPVSLAFFTFQQGFTQNYNLISAAGIIMILPMLVLFLLLQRRFIDGIAATGLGGS
ncbi:carbohydrate ABC transporter permease [Amnibacterium sp.]|uniref:carbohydrate ABC transporter permease n=1 Tax=Amnibacterium sp. TaxID=1872496 RepID=UPI003F7BA3CC